MEPKSRFAVHLDLLAVGKILAILAAIAGSGLGLLLWAGWYFPPFFCFCEATAPRVTLERYRADYDAAAVHTLESAHGPVRRFELPPEYRFLSASGVVDVKEDGVFFPLWSAIPDDAGGYWYLPDGSPQGRDMRGMACSNAIHIDGPWWACGMSGSWVRENHALD